MFLLPFTHSPGGERGVFLMEIWPAIDLRGGACVRLEQGDYDRETVFAVDPTEMARHWVREGAQRLHLVDLDGARDGKMANRQAVAEIVAAVDVPCQLGGGVRDETVIEELLEIGLLRVVIGSRALHEPDWFVQMCRRFPQKLVLGVDARDGLVATEGWLNTSSARAVEFAQRFQDEPVAAIVYTDIARDGMMSGPNMAATKQMKEQVTLPIVASGGVTTITDVTALARIPVDGAIIGRSLYQSTITLADAHHAAAAV